VTVDAGGGGGVVRQSRIAIVVVLLAAGLLGAYWIAKAQEAPVPWPPPPVKVDGGRTETPPVSAGADKTPAPADPKKPVAEKKTGPVRQWISGLLPAPASETGKPKSGLQQTGYKDGEQEPPPPIPPKLTPPPPPSATPPGADNEPLLPPIAPPPMPIPSDLPPIPMPTLPLGMSATKPTSAAPEPKDMLPQAPILPPPVTPAELPQVDPIKSIITEPVQQTPALNSGPVKNTVALPLVAMPQAEAPRGAPLSGAPSLVEQPAVARTPAFVLFNTGKSETINGPATSPKAVPIAPPVTSAPMIGQGPLPSWPAEASAPLPTEGPVVKASNSANATAPVLGVQTPPITVEKRGGATPASGEPLTFQIVVRNLGTVAAQQVRVEDELPTDAKILAAEPTPQMQGTRAVWILNDVPAGGTAVLSLTLQPAVLSILSHNTVVHVVGTASITTAASPAAAVQQAAAIAVQVTAPATVTLGRPAAFEITYTNQSKQRIAGLILHVLLSEGLRHPVGQSIEAEVNLEAGASKNVKVEASTVAPGRQSVQVNLTRPGGPHASAQAAVDVAPAATGLTVQQAPATRVFVGRTHDLRLEVTNNTAKPMRHVSVVSYLPEGVDFVAAGDHGNYQPNTRTVNWLVDTLVPGQTHSVLVRVQGRTAGQLPHQVLARADGVPDTRSSALLAVEGIADLAVSLQAEPALEVGKEAVYEVRVGNPGSGANTNVRVEMSLTPGLLPRNAQGPSPFRIEGQTVIFDSLPLLVPQGQAVYQVRVAGESPGDRRVRVSVTTDQVRAPATRESGTRVYRD
jgi:uncharacterized repeat protein (TIGR01451 family)